MTVPEGYEMPTGVTGDEIVYALAEQPGESATTLYMVLKVSPGKQEILAGDCYPNQGMEIVDALREVVHLRRWKAEASEVMLGLQDLGRALGIPPGQRITGPLALEHVERLKENQR